MCGALPLENLCLAGNQWGERLTHVCKQTARAIADGRKGST
ncbi:hypothetical protein BCAR13_1840036 [Paraburkholderia caribensis]|nr:hypothetical protein BCAR13_1840036 [Paraburkholderia caribensis]